MYRKYVTALVLLALTLAGCNIGGPSGPTATPANTLTLQIAYASSAATWLEPAIRDFNNSGTKTADGKPIAIKAEALGSGAIIEKMVQGASPYDLIIPADKVWLDLLAARRVDRKEQPLNFETCVTVARSPIVMVTWREMAEALGWPERQFTWNDISELALSPSAWQGYDHPEWGTLTFGHAHPVLSDSGLDALLGKTYAAGPLTMTDVQSNNVKSYVRGVERSIARYGSDSASLIRAMAQKGQRYLHVAIGYESDVIANAKGDQGVVAIYPTDTFVANYAACPLGPNAAAGKQFAQWLTGEKSQQLAQTGGIRPLNAKAPLGAPFNASFGADGAAVYKEIPMPPVDVIRKVQDLWGELKRPLNVTLVIDVSGSMRDGGKMDGAKQGASAFVNRLADEDTITVISFSSGSSTLVSQAKVGDQRANVLKIISNLKADGGTKLYDTVAAARQQLKIDSQRINALVVLTDGEDTESRSYKIDSLIPALQDAKGNVTIYTIGYGSAASATVLTRISDAGNGLFFSGDPTTINQVYLEIANQVGGSRGLGR